jgi:excisionase family DNA binding protein
MTPATGKVAYNIAEVAVLLGISETSAREGARRGEIPSKKVGHRVLVPMAAFNKWLEAINNPPYKGEGI